MGNCKFVADVHLAKLAKYLRALGFDTLYFNHIEDDKLIAIAKNEDRWILSKDKRLCQRCDRCLLIEAKEVKEQLQEVIDRFNLKEFDSFSRCLIDNEPLEEIEKEKILHLLPPKVKKASTKFWRCPKCNRIYWHGSHYEKMKRFIDEVGG